MKIGIVALTRGGKSLGQRLCTLLEDSTFLEKKEGEKVADLLAANWQHYNGFICIMAAGIVVRSISPLLDDKMSDPCVVVVDEKGKHAISLLSGHLGGGNSLAKKVAHLLGGTPVITTSSDNLDLVALDLWAREQHLSFPDRQALTSLASILVNRGQLALYTDIEVSSLPKGLVTVTEVQNADFVVSHKKTDFRSLPVFRPKNLVIGTGCNRGTPLEEFEEALDELFIELQYSKKSIRNLASIDKKNDEVALLQFAEKNNWPLDFFTKESINSLNNLEISFAALKAVGAIGVAEPTALLSAQSRILLSRKRKWKNITMAVAQAPFTLSEQAQVQ